MILPAYKYIHGKSLHIPSDKYDSLRAGIVTAELLLLRVIKFEILVPTPFVYLEDSLRLLITDRKGVKLYDTHVGIQSRAMILSFMAKPRVLLYHPRTIACTSVMLAAQKIGMPVDTYLDESNEDKEDIEDCADELMHL